MKNCHPSGNSVGRQKFFYFFAKMLRKHLMHSAKSRLSLRMERALRSGRWDSICCGKQPLNILEVVGLWAPTAVETCHWHVSKSRPSLRMKRALRSGRWDSFSAEKPRRLKHATGMFLRAAFRIPPSEQKIKTIRMDGLYFGGEGGIRTHVACYRQLDFESSSL